jgi:hypothetical protein
MPKFYDQTKEQRSTILSDMRNHILQALQNGNNHKLLSYAKDADTHVRKWAYTFIGRIYKKQIKLRPRILSILHEMLQNKNEKIRQTAIYTTGEIGDLRIISDMLEYGLHDSHCSVRNAVIGSLKVLGQKDPLNALSFARKYIRDSDPEVRRQIVHGIELHGRTHPQDILPILREMQDETVSRVRNMIVHVVGQISYKEGCLETVIMELKGWKNDLLVKSAIKSILKVHREQTYCVHSYEGAKAYIQNAIPEAID